MSVEIGSDALWAALGAMVLVATLASHRSGARLMRPAQLLRLVVASRVRYLAVLVVWMWLGWHFFAR